MRYQYHLVPSFFLIKKADEVSASLVFGSFVKNVKLEVARLSDSEYLDSLKPVDIAVDTDSFLTGLAGPEESIEDIMDAVKKDRDNHGTVFDVKEVYTPNGEVNPRALFSESAFYVNVKGSMAGVRFNEEIYLTSGI